MRPAINATGVVVHTNLGRAPLCEAALEAMAKAGIQNVFTSVKWDSTDLVSFFKSLGFERSEFFSLKKTLS